MDQVELAGAFDVERPRLRAIAFRMLGSAAEADDAVQDTWVRLARSDPGAIVELAPWLTTVCVRICLNALRARRRRGERPLHAAGPEPIVETEPESDPEREALLGDAVGVALAVVLSRLSPAERLAYVLHDMFDLPFDEIAQISGRSSPATRQLASRARRRIRDGAPAPDPDLGGQRRVVSAYFAAAREGDIAGLVAVLDPGVRLRNHGPGHVTELHGVDAVSRGAVAARRHAGSVRPALVNGAAGAVAYEDGAPFAVLAFVVAGERIVALDVFTDPAVVVRAAGRQQSASYGQRG